MLMRTVDDLVFQSYHSSIQTKELLIMYEEACEFQSYHSSIQTVPIPHEFTHILLIMTLYYFFNLWYCNSFKNVEENTH